MCGGGLVDLWDTSKPAYGINGSCEAYYNGSHGCHQPGTNPSYTTGPEELYEEHKLIGRVLDVIAAHDAETPLFVNYDSHIVHSPLQVGSTARELVTLKVRSTIHFTTPSIRSRKSFSTNFPSSKTHQSQIGTTTVTYVRLRFVLPVPYRS